MPKLIAPKMESTEGFAASGLTAFGNLALPLALWSAPNGEASLYLGHVVDRLREMPAGVFQTCVTSPPYWNLRDYGTAKWDGGNPACDHQAPFQPRSERPNTTASGIGRGGAYADEQAKGSVAYRHICGKCGAKRVDQQLGAEDTPEAFVANMVEVFEEVRRVLRDDGTLWINLGSSYWSGGKRGDSGLNGGPTEVESSVDTDDGVTFMLRDDLTSDELQYVLSEIGANLCKKLKV